MRDALNQAGVNPVMRDLKGKTLLPSFIDAWGHFTLIAQNTLSVNLGYFSNKPPHTTQELIGRLKAEAKPLNGWIVGSEYADAFLTDGPLTIEQLDKAFPNQPVFVNNISTITGIVNTAGLKKLGFKKLNVLGWSMGARIAQQFFIRHPEMVEKGILAAANTGGSHQIHTSEDVESKLNNPDVPEMEKIGLVFTDNAAGKLAAAEVLARIKLGVESGALPNDFKVSKETTVRQDRARTTLWNKNESNFNDLKNIKFPVLVTDGRYDVIDIPKNSQLIANQIPYSWLAFYDGGHAFLFQQHTRFAETVNAFLK